MHKGSGKRKKANKTGMEKDRCAYTGEWKRDSREVRVPSGSISAIPLI